MIEQLKRIILGLATIVGVYIAFIIICIPLSVIASICSEWVIIGASVIIFGLSCWYVGMLWRTL